MDGERQPRTPLVKGTETTDCRPDLPSSVPTPDEQMETPMTPHRDVLTRSPDELQAQILLALLHREIDEVTNRIGALEQASDHASMIDPDQGKLRRTLIGTLSELYRQVDNIKARFPVFRTP